MDSKPVMAATRQNNFKNPRRNTRNKYKLPRRNLSATLSYYSYQQVDGQKDSFIFFWWYRTHVIVSKEGISLVSLTLPNNATVATVARKLIKKLKRLYRFKKGAFFIADAAYDERDFYNFIVNQFKGQAFIPINPRNQQAPKTFGPHGCPLCEAGLEMSSRGTWTEDLRQRAKFRCPIKASSKVALQFPDGCPINHARFTQAKAYGCTKYLDITDDPRSQVPRDSAFFKQTFKLRTEVERYFARIGDREVEVGREPSSLAQAELPDRGAALEHHALGAAGEQALASHPEQQVFLREFEEGELPAPAGVVTRDEPQLALGDHQIDAAPTGSTTLKRVSRRAPGPGWAPGSSGTTTRDRPSGAMASARSGRPKAPAR